MRLGRTGDGGVDAVIKLDPLGLDLLYIQAECHAPHRPVDVGEVRDFSGSLDDKKYSRGVMMTTARFTKGAQDYARGIRKPIVLIDGAKAGYRRTGAHFAGTCATVDSLADE